MNRILARERITIDNCEPYVHEHNGCAERFNLEIELKVSVNLISAKMPFGFWGFALGYTIHVHNRTPNSAINFKTPFEVFFGYPPKIKHIRRFGCLACVYDNKANKKFRKRGKLGFLIGCDNEGYTIYYPKEKTQARSKHVDFVESRVYGDYFGENPQLSFDEELSFSNDQQSEEHATELGKENTEQNSEEVDQVKQPTNPEREENRAISKNDKRKELTEELGEYLGQSNEYDVYQMEEEMFEVDLDDAFVAQLKKDEIYEPYGYKEAMECDDREKWVEAMNEEFDVHDKCETWKIVKRSAVPSGASIVKARWVNKIKLEANGSLRYKSRLVGKGFLDANNYERGEICAPVARMGDVRFIFIIASKFNLKIKQYDIRTAFLNSSLEKQVFMEIPEGLSERLGKKDIFRRNNV